MGAAGTGGKPPLKKKIKRLERNPFFLFAGALVALVAGIFGIVDPPWKKDPVAAASNLMIEGYGSNEPNVGVWVLPFDAPLEDFPNGNHGPGCSSADVAWLDKVGRPRRDDFRFGIRNKANAGGMLSLTNIRVQGDRRDVTDPVLYVSCSNAGEGDTADVFLDVDKDAPAPMLRKNSADQVPFAFNLLPGESGNVDVSLTGDMDFEGKVLMDVTAAGDEDSHIVEVPIDGNRTDFVRGGKSSRPMLFVFPVTDPEDPTRPLSCSEDGEDETPCSEAGVRAKLARIWSRPELAAQELARILDAADCDRSAVSSEFAQIWPGFFRRDPSPDLLGYETLVRNPITNVSAQCGDGFARDVLSGAVGDAVADSIWRDISGDSEVPTSAPTAASTSYAFTSPSGNIACLMATEAAMCDIEETDWEVPDAVSSCVVGEAPGRLVFEVREDQGTLVCGEDPLGRESVPALNFGDDHRVGAYVCTSSESGVECSNRETSHGFELSRATYRTY